MQPLALQLDEPRLELPAAARGAAVGQARELLQGLVVFALQVLLLDRVRGSDEPEAGILGCNDGRASARRLAVVRLRRERHGEPRDVEGARTVCRLCRIRDAGLQQRRRRTSPTSPTRDTESRNLRSKRGFTLREGFWIELMFVDRLSLTQWRDLNLLTRSQSPSARLSLHGNRSMASPPRRQGVLRSSP